MIYFLKLPRFHYAVRAMNCCPSGRLFVGAPSTKEDNIYSKTAIEPIVRQYSAVG